MKISRRIFGTCFLFLLCLFLAGRTIAQDSGQQTTKFLGLSITLNECKYAGGLINCYLTVTSVGQDRNISRPDYFDGSNHWNITDSSGRVFSVKTARYGNKEWEANLVADLATPMVITANFSGDSKISLIEMPISVETKWSMVRFRDVSVENMSPAGMSDKAKVEYNGVTVAFDSCGVSRRVLTCNFTAVSTDKDSNTDEGYCIGCRSPRIVDNLANEYSVDKVIYGNREDTRRLVADTPTPVRVISTEFSPEATAVALLEIRFQDTIINFRNLPLQSGARSENNPTPYHVSKNNIAHKKPVTIDTNGADDDGKSCRNPSEITDGSLLLRSNDCSTDGVVGFQNNDYNQIMEVTVKIDLQQTYNITKIRYNQGNVQRAETWNADFMATPFGKTRTLSGSPNKGVWTEQTGSVTTSILQITFQKTRKKYAEDWLYIGEIEVIGTEAQDGSPILTRRAPEPPERLVPGESEYKMSDPALAKAIQDELGKNGISDIKVRVLKANPLWVKVTIEDLFTKLLESNDSTLQKIYRVVYETANRLNINVDLKVFKKMTTDGKTFTVEIPEPSGCKWVKINGVYRCARIM